MWYPACCLQRGGTHAYDVATTGNTGYNQPLEIMNPRLLRFGARFQF